MQELSSTGINVRIVPTADLRVDGGTQVRLAFNAAVATEYAESLREGQALPPVVVFHDGKNYWAADGFHRIDAHRQAGIGEIACDVREGTKRDAFLYALGANAEHGLRRTVADRERAIELALSDPEISQSSVAEIARITRTSQALVSKVCKRLESAGAISREKAIGADGKSYPPRKAARTQAEPSQVRAREPHCKPGGDAEAESKPSRRTLERATHFDDSQFDRLFGPLVRFIQARSERLNCVNCVHKRKIDDAFDVIEAEFRAWQKAMPA